MLIGMPLYYWPLIGRTSPEPELIRGATATVNGATAIAHNAVIYPAHNIMPFAAGAFNTFTKRLCIMNFGE